MASTWYRSAGEWDEVFGAAAGGDDTFFIRRPSWIAAGAGRGSINTPSLPEARSRRAAAFARHPRRLISRLHRSF